MKRLWIVFLATALLVGCGGSTAAISTVEPTEMAVDPTCVPNWSDIQAMIVAAQADEVTWADYTDNGETGVVVFLPNDTRLLIPACARNAALGVLNRFGR